MFLKLEVVASERNFSLKLGAVDRKFVDVLLFPETQLNRLQK